MGDNQINALRASQDDQAPDLWVIQFLDYLQAALAACKGCVYVICVVTTIILRGHIFLRVLAVLGFDMFTLHCRLLAYRT
jgi:hypothetical protein